MLNILKMLKIRTRIILLISIMGIVLSVLLAFYAPRQAKNLGRTILKNDAEFIANLLADNLSVGMEMLMLDDGASLTQTLNLLEKDEDRDKEITGVWVFDVEGSLKASLRRTSAKIPLVRRVDEISMDERGSHYRVWLPMRDSDGTVLGHVGIDFSKRFLLAKSRNNMLSSLTIALVILAATLGLGVIFAQSVACDIRRAVAVMKDIAQGEGDLTRRLDISSKDEIAELNRWINNFIEKLHDIISQVKTNTESVAAAIGEINASTSSLASGAEEQSAQAAEVATSVQEMTATIMENSKNGMATSTKAEKTKQIAEEGTEAMNQTRSGMEEIVATSSRIGEIISSLSKQAGQIGEIIQVIDEIADQTNLLALNAAIEAARAGEQGRGFAVVADEVRKLAERTTKATAQIEETITAIQQDTRNASEAMQTADGVVQKGREAASRTENIFGNISQSVTEAMDMIAQIAAASEEMGSGAEQISNNVESINSVTTESARSTENMAGSMSDLAKKTENLKALVNQFKLDHTGGRIATPEETEPEISYPRKKFNVRDVLLAAKRLVQ